MGSLREYSHPHMNHINGNVVIHIRLNGFELKYECCTHFYLSQLNTFIPCTCVGMCNQMLMCQRHNYSSPIDFFLPCSWVEWSLILAFCFNSTSLCYYEYPISHRWIIWWKSYAHVNQIEWEATPKMHGIKL